MCVTDSKPCGEWPYNNRVCPICGKGIMTSVVCRKLEAQIHFEHCAECEWSQGEHCMYYTHVQEEKRARMKAEPPKPKWKVMLDDWYERNS